MAARNSYRRLLVGAAVAALVAPLAVVAALASPASAAPGKPHEVYMYKVEKHVDLSGEFPDQSIHEHVYCNNGDIALDGMWRVDHVDQAQPPDFVGDERDVYVHASYPTGSADNREWHFRITNFADGDAQIKLFVTCIRGNVEQAHGHNHSVVISDVNVEAHNGLVPGGPNGPYDWDHGFTCAPGFYAVAPGYNITTSSFGQKVRLVHNWPTIGLGGWHWGFVVEDPVDINVYFRCLSEKVFQNGNGPHSHKLAIAWRPFGFTGHQQFLSVLKTQERRLNCDDGPDGKFFQDYKAMVGAWWIDDPFHVWFLGMDPRPKQRAYKWWWDGGGSNSVWMNILCIRARTGKQIAP